jgi:MinD superfamily P-loop ATPase
VKKFKIKAGCIINKSDINKQVSKEIENFLEKENIVHISSLPYDETFTEAMTEGKTIVEYEKSQLYKNLVESWEKVQLLANK